jgi:hypothetical protein
MGLGGPTSRVSLLEVLAMVASRISEGESIELSMGPGNAVLIRELSGGHDFARDEELELRSLFEGEALELLLYNYREHGLILMEEPSCLDDVLIL